MPDAFDPSVHGKSNTSEVSEINSILQRLHRKMQLDTVVQDTTNDLINFLKVDRVVLYHFYAEWEGRVTFESLSDQKFSILGSTGPDECFNGEYAGMYSRGRVSAIADIEDADIAPCHRDFLRGLKVRANLVVPILPQGTQVDPSDTLWGLLVAHHCQSSRRWSAQDIEQMHKGAEILATASSIQGS